MAPEQYPKNFCVIPFMHMGSYSQGFYRYCCRMHEIAKDENGRFYTMDQDSLADVWNGHELKEIRQKMLRGETVSRCHSCHAQERNGGPSDRLDYNRYYWDHFPKELEERIESAIQNRGEVHSPPLWLEIRASNRCNLQCRMCSPEESHSIAREYKELAEQSEDFYSLWKYQVDIVKSESGLITWDPQNGFLRGLTSMLPSVRRMNLLGGEPTMIKWFEQLLTYCAENQLHQQITFEINTNLSLWNSSFFQRLKKMDHVVLKASIDGYGAVQEYIRYPSRWREINFNIKYLLAQKEPGLNLSFNSTLQIYNILHITDFFRYVESLPVKWGSPPINPNLLSTPSYLNAAILPKKIKDIAIERICEYRDQSFLVKQFPWFGEKLTTICQLLNEGQEDTHLLKTFWFFTQKLDQKRGQELKTAIPELYQLLFPSIE